MNASLNITKMGVKSNTAHFPSVNLPRIPEYFKQTPSEAPTHKLIKLLRKVNSISLDLGLTLKPQETA